LDSEDDVFVPRKWIESFERACKKNNFKEIKKLVEQTRQLVNLKFENSDNETALHIASNVLVVNH
jgi:hypothetical protein